MAQQRVLASPNSLLQNFETSLSPSSALFMDMARRELHSSGTSLYLVGGTVRDLLLGIPTRDIDFAIQGDAIGLARALGPMLGARVTAHPRFGTATIKLEDVRFDLATARSETYPSPGSLPVVSDSTLEDDLGRRDFAINSMALAVAGPAQGNLLDPYRGQHDLEAGIVRALHAASFIDDPTRMIRAVRYEQRLGFQIESHTLSLIAEAVALRRLPTVGGSRMRQELALALGEQYPCATILRMGELSLLDAIFPGLGTGECIRSVDGAGVSDPIVYLAALAFPLPPDQTEPFTHQLNMSRSWASSVRDAVALRQAEEKLSEPELAPSEIVAILDGLALPAIRVASLLFSARDARDRTLAYLDRWRHVRPLLTGNDLAAMGVTTGPMLGRILDELRRARLDGNVTSQEDEAALAGNILAREGGEAPDG